MDRYGFRGHNFNAVKIQPMQVTWEMRGSSESRKILTIFKRVCIFKYMQ